MLFKALLLLVAALNLVPGVVALRPERTEALYGIAIDGPALALAMRHRAVLLTLVGVLLGVAAFDESWLRPALLVAFVSKGVRTSVALSREESERRHAMELDRAEAA